MPKNLKKGTLWDFLTFVLLQGIKQREGGPFGNLKKIRKNLKIENFEKSHSAEKSEKRTLWDSLTFVLLQGIKQREGGPFGNI